MKELEKLLKDIKEIYKKDAWNYRYQYFTKSGKDIIYDEKFNDIFGSDRSGYEKYKSENLDSYIEVSGKVSLREVKDSISRETIGYITEEKLPGEGSIQRAREIYEETFNIVREILKVKDNESFMFYVIQNEPKYDFKPSINEYIQRTEWLVELVRDYENDEEFRHFLNKIKD